MPHTETFSLVEVLYDGRWGAVCGSAAWSELDGQVACRELGFDGTIVNVSGSVFSRFVIMYSLIQMTL